VGLNSTLEAATKAAPKAVTNPGFFLVGAKNSL